MALRFRAVRSPEKLSRILALRLRQSEIDLIFRAAASTGQSFTGFVRKAAVRAATPPERTRAQARR